MPRHNSPNKSLSSFQTRRLHCQLLAARHETLFCSLYSDQYLMRHIGPPLSQRRARKAFARSLQEQQGGAGRRLNWIATEVETDTEFAIAGLTAVAKGEAEIGCILQASHHGKGFATELLGEVVRIGFERLGFEALTSFSILDNRASFTFMDRLGFSHQPAVRDNVAGYNWKILR